jgi:hypothetical protein
MNQELEFDKRRSRVKLCPCGKSNKDGKFVPYVGHDINGYCHSCGETFKPPLDKSIPTQNTAKQTVQKKYPISAKFSKRVSIDLDKSILTEITVYDPSESGVIKYHSLRTLVKRLNTFKRFGGKDTNPSILKGIYKGGTSGSYCIESTSLLPFDIDVNPNENEELLKNENNKLVFDALRKIAVLVWKSNSGKGIAGFVWVSSLEHERDTQEHLTKAKVVYELLAKYISAETKIKVVFDWQQGKFRQIRYLAEQTELIKLNNNPLDIITLIDREKKSLIDAEVLKATLNGENNFVDYLYTLFDEDVVRQLQATFFIGSSNHWNRSTIFWQIDINGKIRSGRIILYDPKTGERVTSPFEHVAWVHTKLKDPNFILSQCFFGENQLKGNQKPCAIVESEKTAIIMSVFFPQYIWLACGGKDGLTNKKMEVLIGRTVTLFPDNGGYELWNEQIKSLPSGIRFTKVSNLLERKATAEEKGNDLADYLIRASIGEKIKSKDEYINSLTLEDGVWLSPQGYPMTWDLFGNDANEEIKEFIRRIEQNPQLIQK